ncbi:TIGR03619 family F420-dependent LLM class oxidoreductase [Actinacidiphila sp. bgisy167]|uniref:TIGR03619 family F420-dependent LLM class oxidoreductase n=1 Tax=Actinacidiphila sp. bgisy167 TaxID=3413797 RepID=UPI003D75DA5F
MELGVSVEPPFPTDDGTLAVDTARRVEELGFHYVLMSGHVLANANGSAADPLVLLAAVAGATSRIRLATSVLVTPYYNPVVLANQASTLDVVSGGRFTLGVGTGWNEDEFAALGVPVRQRGTRTDEALQVMRALWQGGPTSFEGRYTTLREARIGVVPRTPGGPRVWVGGHSEPALKRALRLGDGWHGGGLDPRGAAALRAQLRRLGEETGYDAERLELSLVCFLVPPGLPQGRPMPGRALGGARPSAASVVDELAALAEAGISMCSLWMPVEASATGDALAWVAEEVKSKL